MRSRDLLLGAGLVFPEPRTYSGGQGPGKRTLYYYWKKVGRSNRYLRNSERECARRQGQIDLGRLRKENGLCVQAPA